jgi:capsular exopolysaccharide synthesis family protein
LVQGWKANGGQQSSKETSLIKQSVSILRRGFWLMLGAALLTSGITYLILQSQPPIYAASARLIVGPGIDAINPDLNDLRTGGQLMQTYAELALTEPVLQTVVEQLQLAVRPEQLKRQIVVRSDETTQILQIQVQAATAEQAVALANALADRLVQMSPARTGSDEEQIKARIAAQITKLEQDVAKVEQTLADLLRQLQDANTVETRLLLEGQLEQERTYLADARRTLASFYDTFQDSYTNQVKIIERATRASAVDANLYLSVLMAGLAGAILALVLVVGFDYWNDTITTAADLALAADIPLLGEIAQASSPGQANRRGTQGPPPAEAFVVQRLPGSRTTESYRMLGSKLLISRYRAKQLASDPTAAPAAANGKIRLGSIVISGTQLDEESSEIAANLAVILAQTGHRIILVDAYLHRPQIGPKFGLEDREGLSTLLSDETKSPHLFPVDWAPNLLILPSGPVPANPFDLLVSNRMATLMRELEAQADLVLVAASPLLAYADSLILASRADGVIVVIPSGQVKRETVREAVDNLRALDANVLGAILDFHRPAGTRFFARPRRGAGPASVPPATQSTANVLKSANS